MTSGVIFVLIIYFIITFIGFVIVFHIQKRNLVTANYNNLHDVDLLQLITTLGNISERQAICSAMLTDGRDLFENHINMELARLIETGALSVYIQQHFINVLAGDEPLIIENNDAILVA